MSHGGLSQAREVGHIFEHTVFVVEESVLLVCEVADEDVRPAVVVVVVEADAHPGKMTAILVVGGAGRNTHLSEGAIVIVVEQLLGDSIIGDEDVGPAIAIVIADIYAEAFAWGLGQARLL